MRSVRSKEITHIDIPAEVQSFFGTVGKPFWNDRPVAIIGGGPSLIGFDFERLRGAHVLAVKTSIFDIPWADAGFGLDMARYMEWRDKLANVQARVYWAVPDEQADTAGPPAKNVTFLRRLDGAGVSTDPGEIYGGGTSGFGAVQIALHKRAKDIVLFGFDYDGAYTHIINAPARQDPRYIRRLAKSTANWLAWSEHFSLYVPYLREHGIRVINACPSSAINCFQKMTVEDGAALVCGDGK
jgi:hypothetical protein